MPVPKIGPTPPSTFYLLALAAAAATLLIAWAIRRSQLGAGLFAIHDDEDAAEVMGVPTYRYKLVALAISCALAGVAGGIHALFVSYVTVGEVFTIDGAADGGADERARRHAPLGRPGGRRGGDHAAAVQLHRRPTTRCSARRWSA